MLHACCIYVVDMGLSIDRSASLWNSGIDASYIDPACLSNLMIFIPLCNLISYETHGPCASCVASTTFFLLLIITGSSRTSITHTYSIRISHNFIFAVLRPTVSPPQFIPFRIPSSHHKTNKLAITNHPHVFPKKVNAATTFASTATRSVGITAGANLSL